MDTSAKIEIILNAAEEVMSEKGLQNSSIAEIAKKAGVADSLIYNYFKGKEDLLFSIPGRRMKEVLKNLSEQLQGIPDPISRLSKMIWFHLHFNDTYRGYASLLLLECRSNRNFYQHKAYGLIRQYAGIMIGILEDGVEKQIFRSDVDMNLVRDIIFGVLDWEGLSCLASQEIKETVPDLEHILDLILPMITFQTKPEHMELDKSSQILKATETVFAEKGYIQATISEIARISNVSEGTIYEYFENKEDLLLSIPEQRFKEHINALEEVFELKTPLRKLRRFIRYHFYLYLTEPNFLKVFLLHVQLSQRFYRSHVYKTFQQYTQIITDVLEEGKKDGSIRIEVNNRVFKNLFLGAFSHMALRWLILGQEAETDKMREINEVVLLLSRAVASSPGDQK
ncbi:MAG: helix-turn-helix transcriptional regulator [Desulfobacteraceae bacterium]|nr:helix-turn-helix transcriptional regulator [Desulfobacteraceae bacterium]